MQNTRKWQEIYYPVEDAPAGKPLDEAIFTLLDEVGKYVSYYRFLLNM